LLFYFKFYFMPHMEYFAIFPLLRLGRENKHENESDKVKLMTNYARFHRLLIMWQKRAFQISFLLCSVSFLVVLFLIFDYKQGKNQSEQTAKNRAKQEVLIAVQQIDSVLEQLSSIAHAIANDLNTGKLQRTQIVDRLHKAMKITPHLAGIGVAYIPYVNDPQIRRQSPYYVKRNESQKKQTQDLLQVVTIPCSYNDPATQHQISKCVVFVDYSLKNIKALITKLDIGNTGYGFILSKQGTFIAHPIAEYVKNQKTIFDIAELTNNKILKQVGEQAIKGESGVIEYIDGVTEQSTWILHQLIPATDWMMGTVIAKNEMLGNITHFEQKKIEISLLLIVFIIFFVTLLFLARKRETHLLWKATLSASLLLLIGIGVVLYLAQTATFRDQTDSTIIRDKTGLHKFLSTHQQRLSSKESPIYIPFGISLDSIVFFDENNVTLTGDIWQKYNDTIHQDISQGFIFPEAKSSKIVEIYRHKENHIEVIKWHFEYTLHQQFDYSKYPFDSRTINLSFYHKDFDKNVNLIPDKLVSPSTLPAIKPALVLPNWIIKSSFFNYKASNDNNDEKKKYFSNLNFSFLI
ncbi:Cache 3/Cache 2 fusion domain-containing protein, partial [Candidatus Parabeggiatoa sp. HSG14]|uniref:PDC sensor domain-containing protein n=1 Tax=Candidatus Parabeggiatoa sp. HSG14 TaxID=3055593 RepID=UPI0025A81D95|nr:Cache 3/Cache 2 fusion domain-containing protein [Thiotrichales bacterium HSG14]